MRYDLFALLLQLMDTERYLMYIVKNAAYDNRYSQVVDTHYKDIQMAITNCRRVIDEVLMKQHKACN